MTTGSTLADRARGTAFEILYSRPASPQPPELSKEELAVERNRTLNRERARAKRAMQVEQQQQKERHNLHSLSSRTGVMRDNKQYANWTI